MYKKKLIALFAVMSFVLLFGCSGSKTSVKSTNEARMLTVENDAERADIIKRNEAIANEIVKIKGIKSSYVMLSDQNAYVAVSLDENEPIVRDTNISKMDTINNYPVDDVNRTRRTGVVNEVRSLTERATDTEFMSTKMRSEIEALVKKKEPNVKNVHISASPDFVIHMNGYMSDLNSGKAMRDVMNDFNQFVRNMFPKNRY